jgi:nitrite reductase (NO-forming)
MQKAIDENPTYVLFNGAETALTGRTRSRRRPGQRIRMFVGNGGPNLVSSFHVIGEIFDKVQTKAARTPQENVQTTLIPAGGAGHPSSSTPRCRASYIMVDHSIFRAFNKGALAILEVSGDARADIYSGKQADESYLSDKVGDLAPVAAAAEAKAAGKLTKEQQIAGGWSPCSRAPVRSATRTAARAFPTCSRRWRSLTTCSRIRSTPSTSPSTASPAR